MLAWGLTPLLCRAFTHFHPFVWRCVCAVTLPFFLSWAAKLRLKYRIGEVDDFLYNNHLSCEPRFCVAIRDEGSPPFKKMEPQCEDRWTGNPLLNKSRIGPFFTRRRVHSGEMNFPSPAACLLLFETAGFLGNKIWWRARAEAEEIETDRGRSDD